MGAEMIMCCDESGLMSRRDCKILSRSARFAASSLVIRSWGRTERGDFHVADVLVYTNLCAINHKTKKWQRWFPTRQCDPPVIGSGEDRGPDCQMQPWAPILGPFTRNCQGCPTRTGGDRSHCTAMLISAGRRSLSYASLVTGKHVKSPHRLTPRSLGSVCAR